MRILKWGFSTNKGLPFSLLLFAAILVASCAQPPQSQPAGGQKSQEVDWLNIELKDVNTGKVFKLSDFKGKVVLMETMAVWCPTCLRQQIEIKQIHSQVGDEVVSLSLDIDPNENEAVLQKHAQSNGLDWIWAVSPPILSQQLENIFGNTILNPPSTPVVIIDKNQSAHLLRFGVKSAQELTREIEKYR